MGGSLLPPRTRRLPFPMSSRKPEFLKGIGIVAWPPGSFLWPSHYSTPDSFLHTVKSPQTKFCISPTAACTRKKSEKHSTWSLDVSPSLDLLQERLRWTASFNGIASGSKPWPVNSKHRSSHWSANVVGARNLSGEVLGWCPKKPSLLTPCFTQNKNSC